jgi:acetyl esterase/lipase
VTTPGTPAATATPALPAPPPPHTAPLPPVRAGSGTTAGLQFLDAVPYAAVPGFRPLELDLVLPSPGGRAVPLVVFLHGGGWRVGSRHQVGPAYAGADPGPFARIAAAGIAVASVDYRLTGEARWPAPLHDAAAAVRFVRHRAGELGVDPDRVAVWGESAGGHLAALLGVAGDDVRGTLGADGSSRVAAVAAWYTPSDLRALPADAGTDPDAADTREAAMLGAPLSARPDLAAQASPVAHVESAPGPLPPFLLLHGDDDHFVPTAQSVRFAGVLTAAGADVVLHRYAGADHLWLGSPDAAADALDRTMAFLRERLRPGGD